MALLTIRQKQRWFVFFLKCFIIFAPFALIWHACTAGGS